MPCPKSCCELLGMSEYRRWRIPALTDRLFSQFSSLIYDLCGIHLSLTKKTMLTSRLVSRLRALSINRFEAYYDYVTSESGHHEMVSMIDAVSTNKTDFFREDSHFSLLTGTIIPMLEQGRIAAANNLHIWSAGCSSGEEPYTMGMVLSEYRRTKQKFDFKIFATDISTRTLGAARTGIYKDDKVAHIPADLIRRYLMRGRGENKGCHRVVPELRRKISFKRVNFTDAVFPFSTRFDVIFCRNVIIYFDRKTQQELFAKFYTHLKPGGYFFLGHSEVMAELSEGFEKVESTVYRKRR